MKFAVFTVMLADCNIDRTIELLRQHGYDGVEWRFTKTAAERKHEAPSFWGNNYSTIEADSTEEELLAIKQKCQTASLEIPNLAAYITCGDRDATMRAMKAAKTLGAPSIRVGVPGYNGSKSYNELFADARSYLDQAVDMGKSMGIKALIEVHHNTIAPSASAARRLVDGFDSKYAGIIYDPGNMVYEGYEQYKMGLEIMGEYLNHVHIKNASWQFNEQTLQDGKPVVHAKDHEKLWQTSWNALTSGVVHWPKVMADLRAIGYDGWISFEDFSGSAPSEQLLSENLAYIRSLC